jgi:hypothetical protein
MDSIVLTHIGEESFNDRNKKPRARIVRCSLDLVLVQERLRESESNVEDNASKREEIRLRRRKTDLLSELEMLGNMRRIDHNSIERHTGGAFNV